MVDTINPQTGHTDSFDQQGQKTSPNIQSIQANNYFAGFNKPEDVRVNLAADSAGSAIGTQAVPATPPPQQSAPIPEPIREQPSPTMAPTEPVREQPSFTPAPTEVKHDTYAASENSTNMRAVLALAIIGVVVVAVFGVASYFISASYFNGKLAEENKQLSDVKASLEGEKGVPSALELPEPTEPPASDTPPETTTPPVKTPPDTDEQPIETPQPTNPSTGGNGAG